MTPSSEEVTLPDLCLIGDGDRLLLQNRTKKDWQGCVLPRGHVKRGESFVDAVIRETKEETGLDILHPQLVGIKRFPIENGRYIVLLFKATHSTVSSAVSVLSSDNLPDCFV